MVQKRITTEDLKNEEAEEQPIEIPEQFRNEDGSLNQEALLKSQADGQAEITKLKQQIGEGEAETNEVAQETEQTTSDSDNVIELASKEYGDKGELSPETYEALEKQGLSKALVDQYIAGQVAANVQLRDSLLNAAGGEESYQKMIEWGTEALSDDEQEVFNTALQGGAEAAKAAVEGLYKRFSEEADVDAPVLDGNTGATNNKGAHFESSAQLTKAIADARYKNDKAYRKEVESKIIESARLGIDLGISSGAR